MPTHGAQREHPRSRDDSLVDVLRNLERGFRTLQTEIKAVQTGVTSLGNKLLQPRVLVFDGSFDLQTFERWISQVETYIERHQTRGRAQVRLARRWMSGKALSWWEDKEYRLPHKVGSWVEMKELLCRKYHRIGLERTNPEKPRNKDIPLPATKDKTPEPSHPQDLVNLEVQNTIGLEASTSIPEPPSSPEVVMVLEEEPQPLVVLACDGQYLELSQVSQENLTTSPVTHSTPALTRIDNSKSVFPSISLKLLHPHSHSSSTLCCPSFRPQPFGHGCQSLWDALHRQLGATDDWFFGAFLPTAPFYGWKEEPPPQ